MSKTAADIHKRIGSRISPRRKRPVPAMQQVAQAKRELYEQLRTAIIDGKRSCPDDLNWQRGYNAALSALEIAALELGVS